MLRVVQPIQLIGYRPDRMKQMERFFIAQVIDMLDMLFEKHNTLAFGESGLDIQDAEGMLIFVYLP
jgi:hypothetical protein